MNNIGQYPNLDNCLRHLIHTCLCWWIRQFSCQCQAGYYLQWPVLLLTQEQKGVTWSESNKILIFRMLPLSGLNKLPLFQLNIWKRWCLLMDQTLSSFGHKKNMKTMEPGIGFTPGWKCFWINLLDSSGEIAQLRQL